MKRCLIGPGVLVVFWWALAAALALALEVQGPPVSRPSVRAVRVPPVATESGAGDEASRVRVLAGGQRVDVERLVVKGKTTIVDFFSEYCPPCRFQGRLLAQAVAKDSTVALVKIDVNRPGHVGIDWQSPVCAQYELTSLPHYRVYTPDGHLIMGEDARGFVADYLVQQGLWPRPDSPPPAIH